MQKPFNSLASGLAPTALNSSCGLAWTSLYSASGLTYPHPSYHYRSVKIYIDHVRIEKIWKENDHDHRFLTLHNNMDFNFICFYLFLRKSC